MIKRPGQREQDAELRFGFGQNWTKYLSIVDEGRIYDAKDSLARMLGRESLDGLRFLDAGSGSGLFSLGARQLGAIVHSFDFDLASVRATAALKQRYLPEDGDWVVDRGSLLDHEYMRSLGSFDIVYSWGVLHHTGSMWTALDNLIEVVSPGGLLFISIYNDQGVASSAWRSVKRRYNSSSNSTRAGLVFLAASYLYGRAMVGDLLRWRCQQRRTTKPERGMSTKHDLIDWVGGYPFEVAKPEAVFDFCVERRLTMRRMKTVGSSHGCNEFVFERVEQ